MITRAPNNRLESVHFLLRKVQANIYQSVAPFTIHAWRSPEPVPFTQRKSGDLVRPQIGDTWAKELFDCAWMRFYAQLPNQLPEGELVARIDINGELAIVDGQGTPVRGLTNVKSTFDSSLGGPGKTVFTLPPACRQTRIVELWADCAQNDLFGFIKGEGRIELAQVAVVREGVRQLYYDLETLCDYLLALPQKDAQAVELGNALETLAEYLDPEDTQSVEAARVALAPWFDTAADQPPALTVHAIGHAHLDLAWLWPIRETIRKGARTFANALYNIERYPEYVFGASQPQLFAWMKQHYPTLYARIGEAVRAGRIELQGSFWVEPDCNIPNGESYVRQILHGRRFFKAEFDLVPDYCWEPDVFGYNGQLPQILRKSGHKYFMTQKLSWNVVNRFPLQSFYWEGIDGSRILTHMLPEETYNSPAAARSLLKISNSYAQKDVSDHALMAFGIGDGGGGPDAEHMERLRRAPHLPQMPAVKIEPAADFFSAWSRQADAFPAWSGELYLERHQGTLTTQALVKRNNRLCEIALRELEWAAVLADAVLGVPYPTEMLDTLWKEVLLYQFHDILPGSSIKRVYDECNPRYQRILQTLAALTAERYQALADAIAAAQPKASASATEAAAGTALTVFNSLGWERQEWLQHDGCWHFINVPACGWAHTCAATPGSALQREPCTQLRAEPSLLENEHLRVRFSDKGHIVSLTDKRTGREFLDTHQLSNDLVIISDQGDAWDFETNHRSKDVRCYLRHPLHRASLKESLAKIDGPCAQVTQVWHYNNSTIQQTIMLRGGSQELEFDTKIDWREEATMLRVRFATAVQSDAARYEIPFGHIQRSTGEATSTEAAQIEVAAQQWVDLSEEAFGLALYNDCKYGFRIKERTIDMCILRSVPYPGAPLINKEDSSQTAASNFTDLGRHRLRYALRPHLGRTCPSLLTREARAFNTPLTLMASNTKRPMPHAEGAIFRTGVAFPSSISWLTLGNPQIELAAMKSAESQVAGEGQRAIILRLVNTTNHPAQTTLDARLPVHSIHECNLIEAPLREYAMGSSPAVSIEFDAFEVKTLRLLLQQVK